MNSSFWYPVSLFDDLVPTPSVERFVPACDVEEGQDHFLVTLEMPGVSKEDIKVEVLENQLVVTGERKAEKRNTESGGWYSERRYGKFQRTFGIPVGVDAEKVEANYQDGVLRLMVPKAERAKPRQIKITQGPGVSLERIA